MRLWEAPSWKKRGRKHGALPRRLRAGWEEATRWFSDGTGNPVVCMPVGRGSTPGDWPAAAPKSEAEDPWASQRQAPKT